MMIKKRIIFAMLVLLFIPLVYAGNYGTEVYGVDNYNIGEVPATPTPTPTPTPDSPSGGGGSSCSYDWQCTSWFPSICPESGIQERICANKGDCIGTRGMPNQTQTCEYLGPSEPLFDIYLTLEDKYKEICSGNKIKANIKLENYAKVELLDAYMTYWIIDENNKLIAEYKDTRAVEKKTSFNIELKIPESSAEGIYRVYAEITYSGDKTAVSGESFEVLAQENCKLFSQITFNWIYLIYGGIGVIVILLVLILIKILKKMLKKKTHISYRDKVKQNLKKIKSKKALPIVLGVMFMGILVIIGNNITGFVVGTGKTIKEFIGIFYFLLVLSSLGVLSFVYRRKIKEVIETKRNKYPKESIKGLSKKKVYTEDGIYIGKVKEIILTGNKIDSLRIKFNKKLKINKKLEDRGLIIKFKDVKNVGHIVIVDEGVEEFLEKLNI